MLVEWLGDMLQNYTYHSQDRVFIFECSVAMCNGSTYVLSNELECNKGTCWKLATGTHMYITISRFDIIRSLALA